MAGLACRRRGVETRIKAQWGDERYLLLAASCSQFHDTLGPIANELDRPIRKPSAHKLDELFCPVWNGFMSAPQSPIYFL